MAAVTNKQPRMVLFLGAGASVGSGVPTTISFVDEFLRDIEPGNALGAVVEKLRQANKNSDVEELLGILHTLSDSGTRPPLLFLKRPEYLAKPEEFRQWTKSLESYIRKRCYVGVKNVDYFQPLKRILANYGQPLDVFTVNYDAVVEVFCLTHGVEFSSGFKGVWQPDLLEDESVELRLHKIHGSVTWWETDQGTVVEIPVVIESPETQLYFGANARPLIIYPDPAKAVSRPVPDMLSLLRKRLDNADLLVSVGYSFRDDVIRDTVLEAARINKRLLLVLIGPSAYEIYAERLAEVVSGVPSPVVMHTACLPFAFERIFQDLQENHLRHALSGLRRLLDNQASEVRYSGGVRPDEWAYTCEELAQGGLLDAALHVMKHSNPNGWRFETHLDSVVIAYVLAVWSKASTLDAELAPHLDGVAKLLQGSSRVVGDAGRFNLEFDLSTVDSRQAPEMAQSMQQRFVDLGYLVEHLADMTKEPKRAFDDFPAVAKLHKGIREVADHLSGNWIAATLQAEDHLNRWHPYLPALGIMKSIQELEVELKATTIPAELRSVFSQAEGKTIGKLFLQENH